MAIDPNIIGSHVAPAVGFSPLKAIKDASTYAQDRQKERDDQAERENQAVIQAVMQQTPEDPDTAIKTLKQRGFFGAATGLQKIVTEQRTKQSELDAKELTNRASEAKLLKDSIGDGSPAAWNMTVAKLRGKSPELDKILSQPYTPELAKQVQNFATTEKDRSDAVAAAIKSKALADWMKAHAIDPESQETQQAWAFYMGPEEMSKALVAQQNADSSTMNAETNRAGEIRQGNEGQVLSEGQVWLNPDGSVRARGPARTFAPRATGTAAGGAKLSPAQEKEIQIANDALGLITEAETIGDEIGWKGIGAAQGTVLGILASAGYGTEKEEQLRNAVGNMRGTIAALRAGLTMTAQEKAMLDTYVPNINDGDAKTIAKMKSLRAFLERKKINIVNAASGVYAEAPNTRNGGTRVGAFVVEEE